MGAATAAPSLMCVFDLVQQHPCSKGDPCALDHSASALGDQPHGHIGHARSCLHLLSIRCPSSKVHEGGIKLSTSVSAISTHSCAQGWPCSTCHGSSCRQLPRKSAAAHQEQSFHLNYHHLAPKPALPISISGFLRTLAEAVFIAHSYLQSVSPTNKLIGFFLKVPHPRYTHTHPPPHLQPKIRCQGRDHQRGIRSFRSGSSLL